MAGSEAPGSRPTRYALVGAGGRGLSCFAAALLGGHADAGRLVGVCDTNPLRMERGFELLARFLPGADLAIPRFEDLSELLSVAEPDAVIVASRDDTHADVIAAALEAGCDVIAEKPMVIDAPGCRRVLDAERRSGRRVRVAFNYRYLPAMTLARQRVAAGAVGEPRMVDLRWYLDTGHGADYFRRWHRSMARSGGLFVHKATHHFDLSHWLVGDEPEAVLASGALRVYGKNGPFRAPRCRGCPHAARCPFHWDLEADPLQGPLYLGAEQGDGYIRDGCVFDPEIDIYDTMTATVRYRRGAVLHYGLHAYAALEGVRLAVHGSEGALEVEMIESLPGPDTVTLRPLRGEPVSEALPRIASGHHGADARMLDHLFRGWPEDPLGHAAWASDGARSVRTGVAANLSAARGSWVRLSELPA